MALTTHCVRQLVSSLTAGLLCLLPAAAATTVQGEVSGHWTASGSPYVAAADCHVGTGASLDIDPGVSVLFAPGVSLLVDGSLTAVGTPSSPILFTPAPSAGPWRHIGVSTTGSAAFASCVLRGGGATNADENTGMLCINGGTISLSGCEVSGSVSSGLYMNGGSATVLGCRFFADGGSQPNDAAIHVECGDVGLGTGVDANSIVNSAGYGLYNGDTTLIPYVDPVDGYLYEVPKSVSAEGTWWGSASGPQHVTNVLGLGSSLSDDVDYSDFLTASPFPPGGDVNGDGRVDMSDVTLLCQIAAGIVAATPANMEGDVVTNGVLDLRDVTRLIRYVAGTDPFLQNTSVSIP